MVEPFDPIESLRESFERIEPGERSRAKWLARVQRDGRGVGTRSAGSQPVVWRMAGWTSLAAAAAVALLSIIPPNRAAIPAEARGPAAVSNAATLDDSIADALMEDLAVRRLLSWRPPSLSDLDLGIERIIDEVAGAILRPITRLGAQLETGV